MLAHCSWQKERGGRPTLVILHGMEGSTESRYMLGAAEKALGAGFNVVRLPRVNREGRFIGVGLHMNGQNGLIVSWALALLVI